MRIVFKGNDEHGYLYVGRNDGLKRRTQKVGATCERRTHTCDHGMVYAPSGRNGTTNVKGCLLRMLLMSTASNLGVGKYYLCMTPILPDLSRGHYLQPSAGCEQPSF